MRNKYPGKCADCTKLVAVGEGFFERRAGRFINRCIICVATKKQDSGQGLSLAQARALELGRCAASPTTGVEVKL